MGNLLVKSKEEILEILRCVIQCTALVEKGPLENLKEEIMNLKMLASVSDLEPNHFLVVGARALKLIDQFRGEHNQELFDPLAFADFLWNKHQKYGAEPLFEVGVLGIAMRLVSKINRVINMQTLAPVYTTDDEDTLMDILGYCVLGYQLMRTTHDQSN